VKPLDMTELQHQAQSQHRYTLNSPVFRIRIRIGSGQWIRIRIRIQEGKNDPTKREFFLEILCFEVLDLLFSGLKAFPVAWMFSFGG
jgi:hypothetical protein